MAKKIQIILVDKKDGKKIILERKNQDVYNFKPLKTGASYRIATYPKSKKNIA